MPRCRFAALWMLIALPGCAEPCAADAPLLEISVPTELNEGEALLGFLRASDDWSPFICDPEGAHSLAGVPAWRGSCDLIALGIGEPESDLELDIELLDLHGRLGRASALVDAGACPRDRLEVEINLGDAASELPSAVCSGMCQVIQTCEDPELDLQACIDECAGGFEDPELPCALERRSLALCEARRACAWRPPEHSETSSPCLPAREAVDACES